MVIKILSDDGREVATIPCEPKGRSNPFSSKSIGYHATSKIPFGGQRFQVGCNVVMVHSKPGEENGEETLPVG